GPLRRQVPSRRRRGGEARRPRQDARLPRRHPRVPRSVGAVSGHQARDASRHTERTAGGPEWHRRHPDAALTGETVNDDILRGTASEILANWRQPFEHERAYKI